MEQAVVQVGRVERPLPDGHRPGHGQQRLVGRDDAAAADPGEYQRPDQQPGHHARPDPVRQQRHPDQARRPGEEHDERTHDQPAPEAAHDPPGQRCGHRRSDRVRRRGQARGERREPQPVLQVQRENERKSRIGAEVEDRQAQTGRVGADAEQVDIDQGLAAPSCRPAFPADEGAQHCRGRHPQQGQPRVAGAVELDRRVEHAEQCRGEQAGTRQVQARTAAAERSGHPAG